VTRRAASRDSAATVTAGGITVELSRAGKVLFPGDGITKGDLVDYYLTVAGRMLPYLRDRPLALARYPDGIDGQRIFAKNVSEYFPDWVQRQEVEKQGGAVCHAVADKPATLAYLANQGCVEFHIFTSRAGSLHRPDQVVVDLDPPDASGFRDACECAVLLRELLEDELGLTCFVKTTGGKGLHVHVPLAAESDFDEVRRFSQELARVLAGRRPELLTTEQRRDKRGGLVYADVMRNAYAQTVVAPYTVRARPGAAVATPLHWEEVCDRALEPGRFTLRTIRDRLAGTSGKNDPWSGLARRRYALSTAATRLAKLTES
jgi:bifunctional non-homologous end joining protein LigD